ncbi:hypothetical protein GOV08_00715 [Candidatus Woesearchaeota archaeon]|nr:hypothetical protein [Candidatus Woesearchaeota archaeon]
MNKKAIEISINFIVMLILTIIIFSFSIIIAKKILYKTTELHEGMSKQTEERLQALITSGNEEVEIAFDTKEIKPGKTADFGIAILNTLGGKRNFSINITPDIAVKKDGTPLNIGNWGSFWRYIPFFEVGSIKNEDFILVPTIITSPSDAQRGATNVFNVEVHWYNGTNWIDYPTHSPINKLYVKII